jgi:hypothetical protein
MAAAKPVLLKMHNPYAHAALFELRVYWESLPRGSTIATQIRRAAGARKRTEQKLEHARGRDATTSLREVLLQPRESVEALVWVAAKRGARNRGRVQCDLVQLAGRRVIGGCTIASRG